MSIAKFLPPRQMRVLERDRLLYKLHEWEDKKLVILHAQAGQGKSTLAAGYVAALSSKTVWYSVDQDDDNPHSFLTSLGSAAGTAWPDQISAIPPVPQSRYAATNIHQGINQWVKQVFGGVTRPGLIVLDDCHNAPSSALLEQLVQILIDSTPPAVRFLIISRTRPELDIARLRAMQFVRELAGDELRFTDEEVRDLFRLTFNMHLSENEAALVNGTAEGWPAGLVLMHEYLATLTPASRSLAINDRRSTGFHAHVFDYLAQEVFLHLPPDLQRFLLQTSIVDAITAPLMELLTGLPLKAAGQKTSITTMVQDLADRNLFVSALDSKVLTIRYHALFRDFLRKKLASQTRPSDVKKLYTTAAAYFRKNQDPVRCIDLLLASGQFDAAARQIESCGEEMISRGRIGTLLRWIETLPMDYRSRPWFLFYRAVSCRFSAPRTALEFFDLAFKQFRMDKKAYRRMSGLIYSLCHTIEACFHTGGDFQRMEKDAALARQLVKQSRSAGPDARARLLLGMGMAWFFLGKLPQSVVALKQASALFRKQGDHFYQIVTAIYLTPCALYQGDFCLAEETVRSGTEAQGALDDDAGSKAALHLVAAMTSLFSGKFAEAQEQLDQCRGLADMHALESLTFLSLDIGGWLMIAQGDYRGAEEMLAECKRRGEKSQNAFFSASAAHLLAIALLFQGKHEQALAASDYALAIRTQSGSTLFHAIYLVASGAIRMKLGDLRKAEKELSLAIKMLRQINAVQQEATAHLVLAGLYELTSDRKAALKHLQEGFSIGEERGFTYYPLFDAAGLDELLVKAINHAICTDYCTSLRNGSAGAAAGPRLRIQCFGGFRVLREQSSVIADAEWKSKRAKSFVKLLVSQDNYIVSRDVALEALWPDTDPDAIGQTFNSMLFRARKVLDPKHVHVESGSCILLREGSVLLNRERVWTDVGQFLIHLDAAKRIKQQGKPSDVIAEYEQAINLYLGDFLPEDRYADWAAPLRDRLRSLYLRTLEDAASLSEASGEGDRSLVFHEKLFFADPCSELACCWLMTRYCSDGRRREAIRTYELCERALRNDLDMEPDKKTRTIYRSIIGGG